MPELSTPENDALIARVYLHALTAQSAHQTLDAPTQMVYELEMLSQEVNSGASFEQYFRWAPLAAISQASERLTKLSLVEVAALLHRAIQVAFPGGLPCSDAEKDACTAWTDEQLQELCALAEAFADYNGRITNTLAAFYNASRLHP